MQLTNSNSELEQPYPLARNFYWRLLPALVLLLVALILLVGLVVRQSTENNYLERATRTAQNIARDVAGKFPGIWQRLLDGERLSSAESRSLAKTIAKEQAEYRLIGLKLYDLRGRTLYSHDPSEIGKLESGHALKEVISASKPSVIRHIEPNGTAVFELYVPFIVGDRLSAVFELYEPTNGDFQSTLSNMLIPVVSTLFALLGVIVVLFVPIVRRAQSAITDRTAAIVGMRQRLERLLSRSAVETMRHPNAEIDRASERIVMTLLYSDIRGFTPFCEGREPEQTIEVLNRIIGLQLEEIVRHGGDVDKIIGDAILVRYEGANREKRATATAIAIQEKLESSQHPLQIGIGLFTGPVVADLLGTGERQDYTIIGDSVNISARLCSAAKAREIVGDVATIERSEARGFGVVKDLQVKGRAQPIAAQVWGPAVPTGQEAEPTNPN